MPLINTNENHIAQPNLADIIAAKKKVEYMSRINSELKEIAIKEVKPETIKALARLANNLAIELDKIGFAQDKIPVLVGELLPILISQ